MRLLIALLIVVCITGCTGFWDWVGRGELARDVGQLFKQQGVDVKLECHMLDASRTGVCTSRILPEAVISLVKGFVLREATSKKDLLDILDWEIAAGGCRSMENWSDSTPVKVYRSERRAVQLSFGDGVAFEYLLLRYRPDTGDLCTQVSYAYG